MAHKTAFRSCVNFFEVSSVFGKICKAHLDIYPDEGREEKCTSNTRGQILPAAGVAKCNLMAIFKSPSFNRTCLSKLSV